MDIVQSIHGVPIRLTAERWAHIVENHDDLAGRWEEILDAVERPEWVTRGHGGTLVAWRPCGRKGYLSVVYRELGESDGFVVTAFLTRKPQKRDRVWP
jgi:hypothetical protein